LFYLSVKRNIDFWLASKPRQVQQMRHIYIIGVVVLDMVGIWKVSPIRSEFAHTNHFINAQK